MYKTCDSLLDINLSIFNTIKSSKMIFLDTMNLKQIEYCKEKNIVQELKRRTAKQLNVCNSYAIINSKLLNEFNKL